MFKMFILKYGKYIDFKFFWPASVAQLDARPTGDQEVAGLNPVWSATFFCGDGS